MNKKNISWLASCLVIIVLAGFSAFQYGALVQANKNKELAKENHAPKLPQRLNANLMAKTSEDVQAIKNKIETVKQSAIAANGNLSDANTLSEQEALLSLKKALLSSLNSENLSGDMIKILKEDLQKIGVPQNEIATLFKSIDK